MHFITLQEAAAMTARYRAHREAILDEAYTGQNILPLSETFDRAAIDAVLAQPGCTRLRIYYGMDEDYRVHAVIVGVDAENRDLLAKASLLEAEDDDTGIVERSFRCPDLCPEESPLNSDPL